MTGSGWQIRLVSAVVLVGAIFWGSSLTVKPVEASPLLAPLSNDDVSSATVIGAMPFTANQDTTGATVALDDPTLACRPYGNLVGTVWYKYTPTALGVLNVDTAGSSYDTALAVWRGAPAKHVSAACNDDAEGLVTLTSKTTAVLQTGVTYYIEVAGFASGGTGEGALNLNARFKSLRNQLVNPSFESDANGDGRPDGWIGLTRTRATVLDGRFAGVLKGSGDADVTAQQVVRNIVGGQIYYLSGYIDVPDTSDSFTFTLRVRWRGAANKLVGDDILRGISGSTGGWFAVSAPLVAPVGTTTASVLLVGTSLNGPIYIDSMAFGK